MTRRVFRRAISLVIVPFFSIAARMPTCHDDYTAATFAPADEAFTEFVDEYFTAAHIPFLPSIASLETMGLRKQDATTYLRPDALRVAGNKRSYPVRPGLWQVRNWGTGVREYHLLIREPDRLSEVQAFNAYNDLLGEPFADYDAAAYAMTMLPEDVRVSCCGRYVTFNVRLYGIRGDATGLKYTVADIIVSDYTEWVRQNRQCEQYHRHRGGAT